MYNNMNNPNKAGAQLGNVPQQEKDCSAIISRLCNISNRSQVSYQRLVDLKTRIKGSVPTPIQKGNEDERGGAESFLYEMQTFVDQQNKLYDSIDTVIHELEEVF